MNLLRTYTNEANQIINVVTAGTKEKFTYHEYETITAQELFKGATGNQERTDIFLSWLNGQTDSVKSFFRLNWHMGHSIFNVACKFFEGADIQNIDWFQIYNGEMPRWSHQK